MSGIDSNIKEKASVDEIVSSLDLSMVYQRGKAAWMKTDAPRRDIEDVMFDGQFVMLVLCFFAMALLSSTHTYMAFTHNVEGAIAYVAPIAFELFLVASTIKTRTEVSKIALLTPAQGLVFLVAVIANGVSGWAVAQATGNGEIGAYHVLAIIAAPIVPLCTIVIGHKLTAMIRARTTYDKVTMAWSRSEFDVYRKHLYATLVFRGVDHRRAATLAEQLASRYLSAASVQVSISGGQSPDTTGQTPLLPAQSEQSNGRPVVSTPSKLKEAVAMLQSDPTLKGASLRDLEARTGISKSHWATAKRQLDDTQAMTPIDAAKGGNE